MDLLVDEKFCFVDRNKRTAVCWVRILKGYGVDKAVVVATELPDNPAMSITNAWEFLCGQICDRFNVPPGSQWVEHYPAGEGREETWDLVTFSRFEKEGDLVEKRWLVEGVNWISLKPDDVYAMTEGMLP